MKMKKSVLGLLAIACVGVATLGVASVNGAVEASAETPTAFSSFAMEDGAAIYVGDTQSANAKEGNGIRWHVTMDATQYAALATSGYTDIKFGILVAPEEGYDLTEENVFSDSAIYDWAEKDENGKYVYSGSKTRIANFYTDELFEPEDVDNASYVEFYGALTNLKDGADEGEEDTTNNLSRMFQAKGYIEYKDNGVTKYVFVGDDDNVRSMAYVAQLAIADEEEDAPTAEVKTWLGDNYIAKSPNVNWYIQHYLQKADGTYETTAHSTSEMTGAPSASASAYTSPITVDGYHMNELKTEGWQGFVWANNSTTLKLYYEKKDLSVSYGDYQVGFVQNDYNADAMENKIVDGKLVTVVGDSILDVQNDGIGNVGTARPQLVISGLTAGELYTVNVTATLAFEDTENGMLVSFKEQGLSGNNHYGIGNEGEKTWTASNLVADENGQIAFGSWYGSIGTYTWENVEVTSDEPVLTRNGYNIQILTGKCIQSATMATTIDGDKLVTTLSGECGYGGSRASLVITGLAPYAYYSVNVGIQATNDIYTYMLSGEAGYRWVNGAWATRAAGKDWILCQSSNNYTNSGKILLKTDANGTIVHDNLFYNAGANTVIWDISVSNAVAYGNYTLSINPCMEDILNRGVSVATNAFNQIEITTGSAFGNVSTAGEESAIFIGGLTAGQSYTIHLAYTVSGIADNEDGTAGSAVQDFRKVRSDSTQGRFTFVSGTATDGTSLAGKNINGFYGNGDYVINLTGTADANGMIRFGGFYAGGGQVITYTGITIV